MDLYDERQRIWGFFIPADPAILKSRSAEEWYHIARKLLGDEPIKDTMSSVIIPFVDDTGKVDGEFYLCPWSDTPEAPPAPLTPAEVADLCRAADEPGNSLSFDEVMDALDEIIEEDDKENGETDRADGTAEESL